MAAHKEFYVYAIHDGSTCLYVGKGSGKRSKESARKHSGKDSVLERFEDEDQAYEAEKRWIKELQPTENKNAGGFGGRKNPSTNPIPKQYRGVITLAEFKAQQRADAKREREMEKLGSRRYAAKFLSDRLYEGNIQELGVSKVELDRIREVANG